MKHKIIPIVLCLCLLTACAAQTPAAGSVTFTDALGYEVCLSTWERVVSLYGSFAETWTLAGGTLVGATEDAVSERGMVLGDGVAIVGTVKAPNLEELLALSPDFVILSADIEPDQALHSALTQAGIPHAYFRVDSFEDYLAMLRQFCDLTDRDDLYEQNGTLVAERIAAVRSAVADKVDADVLLLRAFSTGAKAKGSDVLAGAILADLGAHNIIDDYDSLLEELSLEEIIAADPDFIFVTTMGGSTEDALDYLARTLEASPAWAGLSAVQNDRYVVLPKELFHYKPNARWGESYAYLAKLLCPECADEIA